MFLHHQGCLSHFCNRNQTAIRYRLTVAHTAKVAFHSFDRRNQQYDFQKKKHNGIQRTDLDISLLDNIHKD